MSWLTTNSRDSSWDHQHGDITTEISCDSGHINDSGYMEESIRITNRKHAKDIRRRYQVMNGSRIGIQYSTWYIPKNMIKVAHQYQQIIQSSDIYFTSLASTIPFSVPFPSTYPEPLPPPSVPAPSTLSSSPTSISYPQLLGMKVVGSFHDRPPPAPVFALPGPPPRARPLPRCALRRALASWRASWTVKGSPNNCFLEHCKRTIIGGIDGVEGFGRD